MAYEHLMGEEMDVKDHPDTRLAGDIVPLRIPANDNKNLDLGIPNEDAIMKSWNEMVKRSKQPTLTIIPGGKK